MSKVILFGCGRGADVAYRYLTRDSDHEICGFTVEADYGTTDTFKGLPVVSFEEVETHFPPDDYKMFILLGYQEMNHLRANKYLSAKRKGYDFVSYVSSQIYTLEPLKVGENCFIMENQSINLDVEIGNNVVMWSCNHIGDRTVIGDHTWFSSHITIAGEVTIGNYCFLGINASISNHVELGDETFVGAASFIANSTEKSSIYVQSSAKLVGRDSLTFMKVMEASGKL